MRGSRPAAAGLLLLCLAAALYLRTLDTGLMPAELEGGDLITHQYAQVQARPGNAPGYPLYTLGGWLWFHGLKRVAVAVSPLPPNPILLLSSYSTLWALLSLGLLYGIIVRQTRSTCSPEGNWPVAWLVTAFYGVTYFFWYYATTTEQYSSAVAHTLALIYFYLRWQERAGQQLPTEGSHLPTLYLLAGLSGLSLAHMVTVAFLVPALVLLVLAEQPQLLARPRVVVGTLLAAAAPLLSYLYVYLRGAANPAWWGEGEWPDTAAWFWSFLSTAQGREELSWGLEPGRPFFTSGFPALIWQELSVPLLLVGLVGIAWLGRRLAWLLYSTLILYLLFCWVDRFGNWYQVILPAYPLILLGVAAAAHRAQGWLRRRWAWGGGLLLLLLVLAVGWRAAASLPAADSRHRAADSALDRAAVLLDQPLPTATALFAQVHDALALDYLTQIWQLRPDLQVVSSEQAARRLASGQAVLVTVDAAELLLSELPSHLTPTLQQLSPDWVMLTLTPAAVAAPGMVLQRAVGDGIVLVGYSLGPAPSGQPVLQAEPALDVTLYWQRVAASSGDWAISVRPTLGGAFLSDPAREAGALLQQDRSGPAAGLLRFSRLPPGQMVADAYRLGLPAPGAVDGVAVILYRPTDDGFVELAHLQLPVEAAGVLQGSGP